jgi:hypothetical protein
MNRILDDPGMGEPAAWDLGYDPNLPLSFDRYYGPA